MSMLASMSMSALQVQWVSPSSAPKWVMTQVMTGVLSSARREWARLAEGDCLRGEGPLAPRRLVEWSLEESLLLSLLLSS